MSVLRVVTSRPQILPVPPPAGRPDFCWTRDGEILVPPPLICADVAVCGCSWSFCGISTARAATWGVVEIRRRVDVWNELSAGEHVAGHSEVEDFARLTFEGVIQGGAMLSRLRLGSVVGITSFENDEYGLVDRTPHQMVSSLRALH